MSRLSNRIRRIRTSDTDQTASQSDSQTPDQPVLTPEQQAELARRAYEFHNFGITR